MGLFNKLSRKKTKKIGKCASCGVALTAQDKFGAQDIIMGKQFSSAVYCEKCGVHYCARCTLEKWQKEQKEGKEDFSIPRYICPRCGKGLGSVM